MARPGRPIELALDARVRGIPARIWPLVSEPEMLTVWFAFAERFELLEGEGEGRRQRLHSRWRDQDSEVDQVVTDFEPPRLIAWRNVAERLDGEPVSRFASETRFAIELRAEGPNTIVTLRGSQVPSTPWRGLLIRRFGSRETLKLMERSLARLVLLVEGLDGPAARPAGPPLS